MSTILEIATADRNLSALVKRLKAANLKETLSGIGPITISAPVNLVFGKLISPAKFDKMVKQANSKTRLCPILSYHVITSKKLVKDFRDGQKLPTINRQELVVSVSAGEVRINGAKILAKDRQASNGVMHSIDCVNLPSA